MNLKKKIRLNEVFDAHILDAELDHVFKECISLHKDFKKILTGFLDGQKALNMSYDLYTGLSSLISEVLHFFISELSDLGKEVPTSEDDENAHKNKFFYVLKNENVRRHAEKKPP